MCPCDKQTGRVCGHCREAIRDSILPTDMRRAYFGAWKVAEVSA